MSGETKDAVRVLLRLEGVCILLAASVVYARFGLGWRTFAWYFLLPDVSLLTYLAGTKAGSICYNIAHSYVGAVSCLLAGFAASDSSILGAGLIWCAHIGFDRALGYGLKYPDGFAFTHLGRIGGFPATGANPGDKGAHNDLLHIPD